MIARRDAPCADSGHGSGFTLLELLLAMALAALLILGLVQIVSATSTAGSLQSNQAQILDHARFAIAVLSEAVRQAGYRPEPWNGAYGPEALTPQTANGVTANGDRLAVRSWSDLNCFDNRNPELDSDGHPRFYLRESVFDLSRDYGLTRLCRYGPDAADLTTQIRRQGMVPGVESFQVLFGEDGDLDGNIERWVTAGQWGDPRRVLGIRIGLLFASEQAVVEPLTQEYEVLDAVATATADGKLRQVFDFTVAIRGRTP
jgi:prepilin-type N-terminal cleavage/methylation domain-containing protein